MALADADAPLPRDSWGSVKQEELTMNRLIIVARLKPGSHERAQALLEEGPPFDPDMAGLHRHGVYLTAEEAVFLFEAQEVEWIVNDMLDDPRMQSAFAPWEDLLEGPPRLAQERFHWQRGADKVGLGLGT